MRFSLFRQSRPAAPARSRPSSARPRLEGLEDRRLLSAGALDPTFGSGGVVTTSLNKYNDTAYGALLQPNGNLVTYGDAQTSKGSSYVDNFALARYTPAGALDTTFGSGGVVLTGFPMYTQNGVKYLGSDYVEAAALQPDGKIVAAGHSHDLVRYNSNGTLDTSFGSGGVVTYPSNWYITSRGLLIQSNGDLVISGRVAGSSSQIGALLRYTPNGALDASFGSGGEVLITEPGVSLVVPTQLALENGDIVVGGFDDFPSQQNQQLWALLRYTPGGALDTSFGAGGFVTTQVGTGGSGNLLESLLVQPDGRIVAGGDAYSSAGHQVWALARYNVDGSLDGSFGAGGVTTSSITGNDKSLGAALQPNGQIVVAGWSNNGAQLSATPGALEVGVYNPDGSPDTSFGSGGFVSQAVGSGAQGYGVVVQSDGKIAAVGTALVGGKNDFLLARFGPSAAQVGSFTAGPNPAASGSSTTLTVSNITPADPSSTITQVAFYVQLNGTNSLLGYGTQSSPSVWTFSYTVSLAPGSYTLYAQAEDSDGVFGDPLALTLTVQ